MKNLYRLFALFLTAALLSTAVSCNAKEEDVSKDTLDYFNQGISVYNSSSMKSEIRGMAQLFAEGSDVPLSGYIQAEEALLHNLGNLRKQKREIYYGQGAMVEDLKKSDLIKYATCYTKEGYCYYSYENNEKKPFKVAFDEDYSSRLGLYSLGNCFPLSVNGTKKGKELFLNLNFSKQDTAKTQSVFVQTVTSSFFLNSPEISYSGMSVLVRMNDDFEISSYRMEFEGKTEYMGKIFRMKFVYEEQLSSYGTKKNIHFPDLSGYTPL